MKYFLVTGTVDIYEYMREPTSRQVTQLVIADTAEQAEAKFQSYWERKSVEYDISYHACGRAMETIE